MGPGACGQSFNTFPAYCTDSATYHYNWLSGTTPVRICKVESGQHVMKFGAHQSVFSARMVVHKTLTQLRIRYSQHPGGHLSSSPTCRGRTSLANQRSIGSPTPRVCLLAGSVHLQAKITVPPATHRRPASREPDWWTPEGSALPGTAYYLRYIGAIRALESWLIL